jgi:hypothetical protein
MLNQGNPYFSSQTDAASGDTARAFQPAKEQLEQSLGRQSGLPSGFATGARTDLASNQARGFDQQLQGAQAGNFAAKQAGASGLLGQAQIANPNQYAQTATQGNNSIMNAPLASPGIGQMLGGMAGLLQGQIPF